MRPRREGFKPRIGAKLASSCIAAAIACSSPVRAQDDGARLYMMVTCFADQAAILDGMAPHLWHGPSAARDWYRDVLAEGEHLGARDYHVTLGEPTHSDVSGARAYVVVPAEMNFNLNGRPIAQTGATLTVALERQGEDWRIAAWAWTKGRAN
jgi:hypothetical protein